MTNAKKMKAVIDRASRNNDSELVKRLENTLSPVPSQRTSTMQPKHETPKQR
jgi:hypothetical protein